mmetsp:Transcript_116616/g.249351  ORF Transcript_116616/g.249351 Transcript_116616/m.249351 type:complete len:213 (-) Transcript_116616:117-755(-)
MSCWPICPNADSKSTEEAVEVTTTTASTTPDPAPVADPVVTPVDKDIFEVTLSGNLSTVALDTIDPAAAFVVDVRGGPFENTPVKAGMYITKVNSVAREQGKELAKHKEATVEVRKPMLFKVSLDKAKADDSLCMKVNCMEKSGTSLLIKGVDPGPIKLWNEQNGKNPDKVVKENDRLIEVNGYTGEGGELIKKLKLAKHMDLVFSRCPGLI